MKRHLILLLTLALCLTGCAPEAPTAEGPRFTHQGTVITMDAEAAPILSALGQPQHCTEAASCAFDGMDKTYYYGSFYLSTYPTAEGERVYSLWFADDTVATAEGIRIGSPQAAVEAAYGAASFNGSNAYILTGKDSRLTIILTGGTVSSVQYEAILE